jgi:hypothetical protein
MCGVGQGALCTGSHHISSTFNSFSSGLLARRRSFPFNDCVHAALLSSFDHSGREVASPRRAWNTYLFKIRQSQGAHRFLHDALQTGFTSLDFPDICAWTSHASRGRGARHCLRSVAWRLGVGSAGDDAWSIICSRQGNPRINAQKCFYVAWEQCGAIVVDSVSRLKE